MAENVMQGVKPTRMELLKIRKRTILAEKGHKLLSEKRDALVSEFFEVIKGRNELRRELITQLKKAYSSIIEAQMIIGRNRVKDIAKTIPPIKDLEIESTNIFGISVPKISIPTVEKNPEYSLATTTVRLDEALENFKEVLIKVLKLAEIEATIERLAIEIEKTKRRVNALEYIFIPRLKATIKYITMQLEEREREDFFRRKRIKALLKE